MEKASTTTRSSRNVGEVSPVLGGYHAQTNQVGFFSKRHEILLRNSLGTFLRKQEHLVRSPIRFCQTQIPQGYTNGAIH